MGVFLFLTKIIILQVYPVPPDIKTCKGKLDQNEMVNRIKSGKWKFNREVCVI